jgi:predicted nucleotidyltransferase
MRSYHPEQHEEAIAHRVASAFLGKLSGTYDVAEAIMFGSRARGDHRPDSDLDLAVVLNGRRGDFIDTKLDMAGIAFDVLMETGVLVQPFPMWDGDLTHPERFKNPTLIRTIAEDGIRLG